LVSANCDTKVNFHVFMATAAVLTNKNYFTNNSMSNNAEGILTQLEDDEPDIQAYALEQLNMVCYVLFLHDDYINETDIF